MYKGWSPVEHRGTYARPSVCPSIWLWIPPTLSGLKSAFSGLKSAFSGLISAVPRLKLAFSALKSSFRPQISLLSHDISCLGLQISPFCLQISPPKPYKAFNYPLCSNSFGLLPYFLSFTYTIIQSRTMFLFFCQVVQISINGNEGMQKTCALWGHSYPIISPMGNWQISKDTTLYPNLVYGTSSGAEIKESGFISAMD